MPLALLCVSYPSCSIGLYLIGRLFAQQGPGSSGILVGHGNRGGVLATPLLNFIDPLIPAILVLMGNAHHCAPSMGLGRTPSRSTTNRRTPSTPLPPGGSYQQRCETRWRHRRPARAPRRRKYSWRVCRTRSDTGHRPEPVSKRQEEDSAG